jgi:hypothetical protein
LRKKDREYLRQLYVFRYGYCGISETEMGAELTNDHFQPTSQGGSDARENIVYCCHPCNEFKSDHWQPDSEERILHPLNDDLTPHWQEEASGLLVPKTATGQFHIEKLHLNRPQLVAHRMERHLIQEIAMLRTETEVWFQRMEARFNELFRDLPRAPESGNKH